MRVMLDVISLLVALISLGLAFYTFKRWSTVNNMIEKEGEKILEDLTEVIKEILEPYTRVGKQVFQDRGLKGATTRQMNKANELIATDLINMQDPMIQMGLELFPNLKEYVTKNPHLLPELLPRIQALASVQGFKLEDLLNKSPSPSARPHPLKMDLQE